MMAGTSFTLQVGTGRRSHRQLVLGVFVLIGLTACQPVWIATGDGSVDFRRAARTCREETHQAYFGPGLSGDMNRQAFLDRCIAARGFTQVDPRAVPPRTTGYAGVVPSGSMSPPTITARER